MKKIVYFLSTVLLSLFSISISCSGQEKSIVEGPAQTVLPADVYASLMTKYKSIDNFRQGRAIIIDTKGKWGMIDNRGNILIDCLYELIYDLTESYDLLWVKMNGAWGLYYSTFGRLCITHRIDLRWTYSCPKKGVHYTSDQINLAG